jgi:hypothetical protein
MRTQWFVKLITPNAQQAQDLYQFLVAQGYHSHFKKGGNLVEIVKKGPNNSLFFVRTRWKEPK